MSFPAYPQMRDSGVEWLGAIPAHWGVKPLRFACVLNPSKSEVGHLPSSAEVSFLPMESLGEDGTLALGESRLLGEVYQGFTYFRDGDVIVAKITPCFENGKGALCRGLNGGIGFGTTELHVLRPGPDTHPMFLWYVTKSHQFRAIGEGMMQGAAGQKRVPDDFLKGCVLPLPPLTEQCAIATFLDRETAAIDALVRKKERLIELLQEKRQALITQAVTRGLNPSVPMKDTGIEWLGQIPAHWDVKRLKYAARLESGHTPSRTVPEYWENCTIPWISLNETSYLREHVFIADTSNYINELGLANSSARVLPEGTVVLSRDATVGVCGILSRPMATSQHFVNWVCSDSLLPLYLLFVFRGPMQDEFERLTNGATLRTIGLPDVKSFRVPLPPVEEQQAITCMILQETANLDGLIGKQGEQIATLREYRQALISAAVTGKIDVRREVEA